MKTTRLVAAARMLAPLAIALTTITCDKPVGPEVWKMVLAGAPPAAGTVGKPLEPIAILVTVNDGARSGVSLAVAAAGGGTVTPAQATTDVQGRVAFDWTLGTTPGLQKLTVTGPSNVAPIELTVNAMADNPAFVRFTADGLSFDALGDSTKVAVVVTDKHNNVLSMSLTYASSANDVVSITSSGFVKALANGTATVTAAADTAKGSLSVRVDQKLTRLLMPAAPSCVESFGDTSRMTARPADRLGSPIAGLRPHWTSSDPATAVVDTAGLVTFRHTGVSWIIVTGIQGTINVRDSVKVCVSRAGDKLELAASTALPGEVLQVRPRGATLDAPTFPALVGTVPVTGQRLDDSTGLIPLPLSVAGTATVRVPLGKRDYVATLNVSLATPVKNPAVFADSVLSSLTASIDTLMTNAPILTALGDDTARVIRDLRRARDTLTAAQALLAAAPPAVQQEVAAILAASADALGLGGDSAVSASARLASSDVAYAGSYTYCLNVTGRPITTVEECTVELDRFLTQQIIRGVAVVGVLSGFQLLKAHPLTGVIIGMVGGAAAGFLATSTTSETQRRFIDPALALFQNHEFLAMSPSVFPGEYPAGVLATQIGGGTFIGGVPRMLTARAEYRSVSAADLASPGVAGVLAKRASDVGDIWGAVHRMLRLETPAPALPATARTKLVATVDAKFLQVSAVSPSGLAITTQPVNGNLSVAFDKPGFGRDLPITFEVRYVPIYGEIVTRSVAATLKPRVYPVAAVSIVGYGNKTVAKSATLQLGTDIRDSLDVQLSDRTVSWSSSNTAVATVDATGLVTALDTGSVSIKATAETKTGAVTLAVTDVPVALVVVTPNAATVAKDKTIELTARVEAENGATLSGRTISWSSDNASVATVSNGLVTGVSVGTATITAASEGKTRDVAITVSDVPIETIVITPENPVVVVGALTTLTATAKDRDGNVLAGRVMKWSSLSPSFATVSGNGAVTGVAEGTALVTATAEGKSATVGVSVKTSWNPVATVTVSPASVTLRNGATQQFAATLKDAMDNVLTARTVRWASSDTTVARIDSVSGVATAVDSGTVSITATSEGKSGDATVSVGGHFSAASIVTAAFSACALSSAGNAYCWGRNAEGQLGDGTNVSRTVPTPVAGNLVFTELVAGISHVCGLSDGKAYCWGYGASNRIGDGFAISRQTPTRVKGELTFTSLSAGPSHTCGIATSGETYCWGAIVVQRSASPDTGKGPRLVVNAPVFSAITSGHGSACGLAAGALYCWGSNTVGQGARGDVADSVNVHPTIGGITFSSLGFSGDAWHMCGISTLSVAYCWGFNAHGALGDSTTTMRTQPTRVAGQTVFSQITTGNARTCALTPAGVAFCWGYVSHYGNAPDGKSAPTFPKALNTDLRFSGIRAGNEYFCGISNAGKVYCWGANSNGQLGVGDNVSRFTPQAVVSP